MRNKLSILTLLLAVQMQAQTLFTTPTMVGVAIGQAPEHTWAFNPFGEADSLVFSWTCNPFDPVGLYSITVQPGDTLWFDKQNYLRGYLRGYWTDFDITQPIGGVQRDGDRQPKIEFGFREHTRELALPMTSNARLTRVTVIGPSGMILYKNFPGTEGVDNQFVIDKYLPQKGLYVVFVKAHYDDPLACSPWVKTQYRLVVVD